MANHFAGDRLAFDRSQRTLDVDGRLHVASSVLTRACVSLYAAEEIPNSEQLGLTRGRRYALLRDPAELAAAVRTFDRLPILRAHTAVTAADHKPEMVIGATGSDAKFDPATGELTASLVIWDQDAIDDVMDGSAKSLSCGYRYVAVMEPGTYQGQPFAGRMIRIQANHLVTCPEPRVPGAVVGDAQPNWKDTDMDNETSTKLLTFLREKLQPEDYTTAENMISGADNPDVRIATDARRRVAAALTAGAADLLRRFPDAARIKHA